MHVNFHWMSWLMKKNDLEEILNPGVSKPNQVSESLEFVFKQ